MKACVKDNLTIELISDLTAFEKLASEWSELNRRTRSGSAFLSFEWHFTWWKIYAREGDRLHIFTWRCDGLLVGLLPLYCQSSVLAMVTTLRLLGTGEVRADEVATEYGDLLAVEWLEDKVTRSAVEQLISFNSWCKVELNCLLENSLLYRALQTQKRITALIRPGGHRYRLSLDTDEASYMDGLKGSWVKRVKRSQRALARDGGLVVSSIESVADIDKAFRELADLNHERQAHKNRKSVFASERFLMFHSSLCRQLFASGSVNIIRYHLGSRLLAVLYCFYDTETCHYYQSGFAKKDANRFMPLTVAHLSEMQRMRETNRRYYDFMRGQAPCYKDEYGCELTPMFNVSVYRTQWRRAIAIGYRRLRSSVASGLKRLRNTGR